MESPLVPTRNDLEQAFRTSDPNLAGHQEARAVVTGDGSMMVLCNANAKGEREHIWLLRLANDGRLEWERHYPTSLGAGRAIVALPAGGFAIAG